MKFLSELKKLSIGTIIVSALMGFMFLFFPGASIMYMSLIVGIALIVVGVIQVVIYCINKESRFSLMLGVIVLIVGIVVCVKYRQIISLIVAICGVFILASGIVDLFTGIKTAFASRIAGITTVILSIISIIFGFVAITKSAQLTDGIIQFIGVALLVYSVLDLFAYIEVKRLVTGVARNVTDDDEIVVDATIVDDTDE